VWGGPFPPTGGDLISASARAAGWVYKPGQGRGDAYYYNNVTGTRQPTVPLPAGWSTYETPAGIRYRSVTGKTSVDVPMAVESLPATTPQLLSTNDEAEAEETGTSEPRKVVSARGLDDKSKKLLSTGGQQVMTTPFGIVGGAPVKKKKLLGA